MEKRTLEKIKLSLLKQIDLMVWRSHHQTLGELMNTLRVQRLNVPVKPSVDEIFGTLRKERMLEFSHQPGMKELREAVDRMVEGTYGLCQHCGEEMEERALELQPTTRYCAHCSQELLEANAAPMKAGDVPLWSTKN